MNDTPIAHVTDTAFWVATYRANESARPDALFHDPLAGKLAAARGRDIADRIADGQQVAWVVVLRTCIIDDYIREAIAAGCDTILNLGAGLDTRPYRLELPPSLRWVRKIERIISRRRRKQLARAPLQFHPDDWLGFFAARGWRPREIRYLLPEAERRGRKPPVPWWMRLVVRIVTSNDPSVLRNNIGFALMERRSGAG